MLYSVFFSILSAIYKFKFVLHLSTYASEYIFITGIKDKKYHGYRLSSKTAHSFIYADECLKQSFKVSRTPMSSLSIKTSFTHLNTEFRIPENMTAVINRSKQVAEKIITDFIYKHPFSDITVAAHISKKKGQSKNKRKPALKTKTVTSAAKHLKTVFVFEFKSFATSRLFFNTVIISYKKIIHSQHKKHSVKYKMVYILPMLSFFRKYNKKLNSGNKRITCFNANKAKQIKE